MTVVNGILGSRMHSGSVAMVGTSSCHTCRDALRRLESARVQGEIVDSLGLIVILRESDDGSVDLSVYSGDAEIVVVPDRVWWSLIGQSPPVFLSWCIGERAALADSVEELLVALRHQ